MSETRRCAEHGHGGPVVWQSHAWTDSEGGNWLCLYRGWHREGVAENTDIVAPDGERFSLRDPDEVDGLCEILNADHDAARVRDEAVEVLWRIANNENRGREPGMRPVDLPRSRTQLARDAQDFFDRNPDLAEKGGGA